MRKQYRRYCVERSYVETEVKPPEHHVKQIADRLINADKLCLFLDNECIKYEISEEVGDIAEVLGAMVMSSVKIPCTFSNTSPNFVGEVVVDYASLPEDIDCF